MAEYTWVCRQCKRKVTSEEEPATVVNPDGHTCEFQRMLDPYADVLVKLPSEAQRVLLTILSRHDPNDTQTSRKVRNVCQRYKRELDALGLVADFYAYALVYWAMNQSREAIAAALNKLPALKAKDLFGSGGNPALN